MFHKLPSFGYTYDDATNALRAVFGDCVFMREYWPFGNHNAWMVGEGLRLMAIHYGDHIYVSPRGQMHPELADALDRDWWPSSYDDSAWKRINVSPFTTSNAAGGAMK